ncbi:NAD-dependent epimerase/dehydratase family protein [Lacticaseibacillus absianus]|uniref:NAD-dependent epimerase/dehydratase family protein n=1 Tax=Lacticaseibacillus absianus TaxID=2729623 RepID=UPI0015C85610|nr:NAD-dependent epimerase/dehydratase family protein [Lacticaseibacillus absianus]
MQTIVVTGASGFVARWVIQDLLAHGYAVRGSLRSLAKADEVRRSVLVGDAADRGDALQFFAADLTAATGWVAGLRGADGVIHVASPLGHGTESEAELVAVATSGVREVFAAAHTVGITRLVMTSSGAAATPRASVGAVTIHPDFWTDLADPALDPYRRSKVHAERLAWQLAAEYGLALTTILPGAIYGPALSAHAISSDQMLQAMLKGWTVVPKVPLEVSDVRDLATLHRLAWASPAAVGHRYLAAAHHTDLVTVARTYQRAYPDQRIHVVALPNPVTRLAARVVPSLRALVPMLARQYRLSSAEPEADLGWRQRPVTQTMTDAAQSLFDHGLVARQ